MKYHLWCRGGEIEAGLPNITGNFQTHGGENGSILYTPTEDNSALYGQESTKKNNFKTQDGLGGGTNAFSYGTFSFDASRSNSIYGKSNTVQPPAIKVYMWKRIL